MKKILAQLCITIACFIYKPVVTGQINHAVNMQLLINHIIDNAQQALICSMCYERIKPIFNEKLFKAPPPKKEQCCWGWPPAEFVKDVVCDSFDALNKLICCKQQHVDYFNENEDDESCELELIGSKECCYCMLSEQSLVDENPIEISINQTQVFVHNNCKTKLTQNIKNFFKRLRDDSTLHPLFCYKCSIQIGACCVGCSCCCLTSTISIATSLGILCCFKPVLAGIFASMCSCGALGGCLGVCTGNRSNPCEAGAIGCCIGCCFPIMIFLAVFGQ